MEIKNFISQLVEVTESAAIASYKWQGMGKQKAADAAAVEEMRKYLNQINFSAQIAIGEGERDKAPMLFIGEKLGAHASKEDNIEFDLAVDPLEGTALCADLKEDSIAVLAISKRGGFLHAPDVYMEKIAIPEYVSGDAINLKNSTIENLNNIIDDANCSTNDILLTILDRKRHEPIIKDARSMGIKVRLIQDGDVKAIMATALGDQDYLNVYMGTGGAPEGVLAAAALRTLGGHMQGRLIFDKSDTTQKERAKKRMNINDLNKIYTAREMASEDCAFIATGVTKGSYLDGVQVVDGRVSTSSIVLTSWDSGITYLDRSRKF